jgi:flagellar L-ring protein precursor FlgH
MKRAAIAMTALLAGLPASAYADNLYRGSNWSSMSTDRRATEVGDVLTVVIFQAAQSTTEAQNSSRKATDLSGHISGGHLSESGELGFGGGYTGHGAVTRSEKLIAQITLNVLQVLPNGDLVIGGEQWLKVNGERTRIGVRGRIRTADIGPDNSVASNRIADAQIDYDGRGFVSRSAKPGLINRIFSFLGLG